MQSMPIPSLSHEPSSRASREDLQAHDLSSNPDAGSRLPWIARLLNWRKRPSFGRIEALALLAYCGVLALAIPFHEPWSDEAQAWMIARDNSLWQILRYRLHYEGAPALWHILLHTLQALHGTYSAMGWLAGACAAAGIFVMLRWSPFPLLIRILLPFTFFLQYQYAVVVRSYVVFPLLTFILCALYRSRRSALWFGLVAGLLASVSLQGVIFSGMLLLFYVLESFSASRSNTSLRRSKAQLAGCASIYILFVGFAAMVALPAPDQVYASGLPVVHPGHFRDLLMHYPGEPAQQNIIEPKDPVLPQEPLAPEPKLLTHPLLWSAWYVHREEADIAQHPDKKRPLKAFIYLVVGGASEATWPISTSKIVACLFLVLLSVWLAKHHFLRGLFPWLFLIFVGERLWVADHHVGLLLIVLLAAIWIAGTSPKNSSGSTSLDRSFVALFALICVLQVGWSIITIRADQKGNYDAGLQTAMFLKAHPVKDLVGFDFYTEAVQPYFAKSPFSNINTGYWVWSEDGNINRQHFSTIASHPDMVVFTFDRPFNGLVHDEWAPLFPMLEDREVRDFRRNAIVNDLRVHGYHETHRFCGHRFSRASASYESCDVIFEPESSAQGR